MTPRGWSRRETLQRFRAYVDRKISQGKVPRKMPQWESKVDSLSNSSRRGLAFEEFVYDAMNQRGFTPESGWHQRQGITQEQARFRRPDIGNRKLDTAIECKAAGGGEQRALDQLRFDLRAVAAGGDRVWVHADLSREPDRVKRRLEAVQRRYPGRFSSVDLADPDSVADYAGRGPMQAKLAAAFQEAGELFRFYEEMYGRSQGTEFTIEETRSAWTSAQQARLGRTGVRPPNGADRRGPDVPHPREISKRAIDAIGKQLKGRER